jgi:hypothetical protein
MGLYKPLIIASLHFVVYNFEHNGSSLQTYESVDLVDRSGDAEVKSISFLHSAAALFPALQGRMQMTRTTKTGDGCIASPRPGFLKLQWAPSHSLRGFNLVDHPNIKRYILTIFNGTRVHLINIYTILPMASKMNIYHENRMFICS